MHKQLKTAAGAILRSNPIMAGILIASMVLANSGGLKVVIAGAGQQTVQDAVSVSPSFGSDQRVLSNETFELQLSRPLEKAEGKIAILVGSIDLTSLFEQTANKLTYNAKVFALPLGESELTVYLISPSGEWKEISRFPIKVSNDKASKPISIENQKAQKPQTSAEQVKNAETAGNGAAGNREQKPQSSIPTPKPPAAKTR